MVCLPRPRNGIKQQGLTWVQEQQGWTCFWLVRFSCIVFQRETSSTKEWLNDAIINENAFIASFILDLYFWIDEMLARNNIQNACSMQDIVCTFSHTSVLSVASSDDLGLYIMVWPIKSRFCKDLIFLKCCLFAIYIWPHVNQHFTAAQYKPAKSHQQFHELIRPYLRAHQTIFELALRWTVIRVHANKSRRACPSSPRIYNLRTPPIMF